MVPSLIEKSIIEFCYGNYFQGMLNICPAIDSTAKKRYNIKENGKRIKQYLNDELPNLISLGSGIRADFKAGTTVNIHSETLGGLIYKFIRNPIIHEGEWSKRVVLADNFTLGYDPLGKIVLPKALLRNLPVVVVGSIENASLKFNNLLEIEGSPNKWHDLNNYWGKIDKIIEFYYEK